MEINYRKKPNISMTLNPKRNDRITCVHVYV